MDEKIGRVKVEIKRIVENKNLLRTEKYDLIKGQYILLSHKEQRILLREYHRDYATADRIKDISSMITIFLTGSGLFFTVFGIFFKGIDMGKTISEQDVEAISLVMDMFTKMMFMAGIIVVFSILILMRLQMYRSKRLNTIQSILDIIED